MKIPKDLGMDPFPCLTEGAEKYVERLTVLDPSLVVWWVGRSNVLDRAMCFSKPKLFVDFRLFIKTNLQYWTTFVRNERQALAATGYAVLYQSVMKKNVQSAERMVAYTKLTVRRSRIDVTMGPYAEFPQVFT